MLSVRGVYENGQVKVLEPIPNQKRARVIVTILEELAKEGHGNQEVDANAFDDLVGVIDSRKNGSMAHDQYIASQEHR